MNTDLQKLLDYLAEQKDTVIQYQSKLTSYPALSPSVGGVGELEKARYLEEQLRHIGVKDITHIDAPDPLALGGIRPNIIAKIFGNSSKVLWLLGHMDVVPPGDLSQWKSDPWIAKVDGDKIIGRGVEDNQQAIVSGLLVASGLLSLGIIPDISLGLLFVSDEESGNTYGITHILQSRPDIFSPEDFVVVPDYGRKDGAIIEIAEKRLLWVKVVVLGKQAHASTPDKGKNSLVAAADMILHVVELSKQFNALDPLFAESPSTTIVPSKHAENVPNINTVPGRDEFYIDCRILPCYTVEEVFKGIKEMLETVAKKHDVAVEVSINRQDVGAPSTKQDSEVIQRLTSGIRQIRGIKPNCVGIGGGTVAVGLRQAGIPVAVWATLASTLHQANETSYIDDTIKDAQVFATMLFN